MPTSKEKIPFVYLNEQRVKERCVDDLKEHVITTVHHNGLYRHWRCCRPDTGSMGFSIVTWPGSICYTGDMGEYLFQRTEDMVAFMRRSAMSFSYAAEKCVAHDGRLEEWREEVFLEELDAIEARIKEECEDEDEKPEWLEKVQAVRDAMNDDYPEHDAMVALYESGLVDGCDMPSCKAYTFHFLWCLHAIKWFCDNVKDA